jgi:hypothetical protein
VNRVAAVIFILFMSPFLAPVLSSGQEFAGPVHNNPFLNGRPGMNTAKKTTATLSLPFFEDFTSYGVYPDSSKWIDFNVYINNTMCVSPIARGVATFDDLDRRGLPYDSFSNTTFRYADSLTSQPINLDPATNSPDDSIYLSFFYQPQGNGFFPLTQDSLMLFLRTRYGGFVKVWAVPGASLQPFKQVMVPITDTLFFHDQFQFRFINIAAQYWADAVWNVDYVRLDKNRNLYDTLIADIGFSSDPSFLLNDYTSMPYRQFKANAPGETAAQYTDSIHNNNEGAALPIRYNFTAMALNTGTTLQPPVPYTAVLPFGIQQISYPAYTATIPLASVGVYDKVIFENKSYIEATTGTGSAPNDTIVKDQVFDNYLAYDDGTAEKSYYLNLFPTLPGKVAIEHHLNRADTMRGMAIYFGRQIPFAGYKEFSIVIYSSLMGVNGAAADNVLYQQDLFYPGYADTVNHFWIYRFDTPLPMPVGTFYAGTIQNADRGSDSLYFGLDVNRLGGNHAYYNVLGGWSPSLISGAIMMRPLLGQPITGTKVNEILVKKEKWQITPNPAKDVLRFGYESDKKAAYYITDVEGRTMLSGVASGGEAIDISWLASGMYFVNMVCDGVTLAPQKLLKL